MSNFLNAMQSNNATTHNGAISHSTSGNLVLDYFSKSGMHRGRTADAVALDMARIFGEDKGLALKTVFYNRMVTRRAKGINENSITDKVQKGQGQKMNSSSL